MEVYVNLERTRYYFHATSLHHTGSTGSCQSTFFAFRCASTAGRWRPSPAQYTKNTSMKKKLLSSSSHPASTPSRTSPTGHLFSKGNGYKYELWDTRLHDEPKYVGSKAHLRFFVVVGSAMNSFCPSRSRQRPRGKIEQSYSDNTLVPWQQSKVARALTP